MSVDQRWTYDAEVPLSTDLLTYISRVYFNATARSPPWITARAWPSFPLPSDWNRLRHLTSAKTRQCDAFYVNSLDRTARIHLLLFPKRRIISGIRNGKRNDGHVYFFLRFNVYTGLVCSKQIRRILSRSKKNVEQVVNSLRKQWTKFRKIHEEIMWNIYIDTKIGNNWKIEM